MIKDSRELAIQIGNILDEKKAEDIILLDIHHITVIADFFVICSGRSTIQVKALCDEVEAKMEEKGYAPYRKEGYAEGRWVVLDYGDVILHIFHEEERQFYNIERLWADGETLSLSNG
ncbi:MAG: ribosome silencing factor [Clostridia bacterium]